LAAVTVTVLVPTAAADDVAVSVTVVDAPASSITDELDSELVQPLGTARVTVNVPAAHATSLFVIVAVYMSGVPGAPDCVAGASATVGAERVQLTLWVADPLPDPLSTFEAVTITVFVPVADASDVEVNVTAVDAPDVRLTDELDSVPVQPLGTDAVSANVPAAQPASRLVIVAV
jgi:hypothetical protein